MPVCEGVQVKQVGQTLGGWAGCCIVGAGRRSSSGAGRWRSRRACRRRRRWAGCTYTFVPFITSSTPVNRSTHLPPTICTSRGAQSIASTGTSPARTKRAIFQGWETLNRWDRASPRCVPGPQQCFSEEEFTQCLAFQIKFPFSGSYQRKHSRSEKRKLRKKQGSFLPPSWT